MDELEERLNSHARAFEGLMALIPAKQYYGEDNSDQWRRKKQTKEEHAAAKRAKLDPDNIKSAKDIMQENERKRKRELAGDDYGSDLDAPGREQPKQGLKAVGKKAKKQKVKDDTAEKSMNSSSDRNGTQEQDEAAQRMAKAEKKKAKQQQKKEKQAKQQDKTEAKKARKQGQALEELAAERTSGADADDDDDITGTNDIDRVDFSGIVDGDQAQREPRSSVSPSSAPGSPALFDVSANISAASSSSTIPPATAPDIEKPAITSGADSPAVSEMKSRNATPKLPKIDPEVLKARLQARIEELRARRKADGPNGQPARNRQELLDARRKKEEQRRQHKKELRHKAKEEERLAAEGSHSPLSIDIFSPRSPAPIDEQPNNFSFGRVAFQDGAEADASLTNLIDRKPKKGPQDPRTALQAANTRASRLAGLDDAKRADIAEKDLWLNAKKRAHGERVRDDTSLLKKTLKRKEKAKGKSEREWDERIDGVKKGQEIRQKQREANLAKRKEEKGMKGKGASKGKGKMGKKGKGRPGFEGSFKAKSK
ncbi:hypothetical protein LTR16_003811 [Cryomyces antarcticus]|uniref:Ribosomal RNA-processing protein 14/surfeit locus protein 6 C-terminal domain-containing protein n=1 Tax=Cryomyces antarcticus TaxID=329879 RepID=A0ABR0LQ06_9PEZI|nr:hypothetical protein LTR16_003811 [Cryomyces antarcticus]